MVMLKKSGMAKNKNRGPVKKGGPLLDYKKIAGMGGKKAKPKTSSGRPKKSNPFAKPKSNNKSPRVIDKGKNKKPTVTPKPKPPKKTFKKITPKAGEYRSGNVLKNIVENQRKANRMKGGGKTSKYMKKGGKAKLMGGGKASKYRMKGGGKTSKYRMKGGGKTPKYMARGGRAR